MLAAAAPFTTHLSGGQLLSGLILPVLRLVLTIAAGLAVGQIIEATGWTRFLALLTRPVFRFGRLGDRCGAAFAAAFVSGVAANAMLLDFFKEGRISRRQLFLTNFVNQLPAFFLHLPTTFFTVVAMTGRAGMLYFLLTLLAALVRTALVLLYGHVRLPARPPEPADGIPAPAPGVSKAKGVWQAVRARFPGRLLRIGIYVVPIYTAVFVLNRLGFFTRTQDWVTHFVVTTFIPIEALSVVVLSFVAEFTSGFAAAGAFMDAGVLTVRQTVLALLVGNVLAFPLRALRHQLPHYMGIFSPRLGAELLLLGQALRVASVIAAGALFFALT
jgi:hypothetical protein